MNEKIKNCSCCGSEAMITPEDDIANFGTDKWYSCSNDKCIFHGINLFFEDWQSRPIEDSLQKKLELALAHDTQSYPTVDAYEKVCKTLEKAKKKLEIAMDMLELIFEAGSDRSHPDEWVEFIFQNTSATLDDIEKIT
jgi:hypothetical protein